MNEILALAEILRLALRKLRLVLENSYTMTGSMRDPTTADGAENIALKVEIGCDLEDAALHPILVEAIHAAPLGGSMGGRSRACSSSTGTAVTCPPPGQPSSAAKSRAPRRTRWPAVPIGDAIGAMAVTDIPELAAAG